MLSNKAVSTNSNLHAKSEIEIKIIWVTLEIKAASINGNLQSKSKIGKIII